VSEQDANEQDAPEEVKSAAPIMICASWVGITPMQGPAGPVVVLRMRNAVAEAVCELSPKMLRVLLEQLDAAASTVIEAAGGTPARLVVPDMTQVPPELRR
jgi:hypothetical protein